MRLGNETGWLVLLVVVLLLVVEQEVTVEVRAQEGVACCCW